MALIRPAQLMDLEAIREIEAKAHKYPWAESVILRYLNKPNSVWVIEVQGMKIQNKPVGYTVLSRVLEESELLMISIDPEYQGQGFGKQLLELVQQEMHIQGAERMFLEVRESNVPAIALYETLGFCETGRRVNYYPTDNSKREDALIFSMELIPDP